MQAARGCGKCSTLPVHGGEECRGKALGSPSGHGLPAGSWEGALQGARGPLEQGLGQHSELPSPLRLGRCCQTECGLARSPGNKKEGKALALLSLLRFGDAILGVRAHRTFDCSSACAPGANGALVSSGVTGGVLL